MPPPSLVMAKFPVRADPSTAALAIVVELAVLSACVITWTAPPA